MNIGETMSVDQFVTTKFRNYMQGGLSYDNHMVGQRKGPQGIDDLYGMLSDNDKRKLVVAPPETVPFLADVLYVANVIARPLRGESSDGLFLRSLLYFYMVANGKFFFQTTEILVSKTTEGISICLGFNMSPFPSTEGYKCTIKLPLDPVMSDNGATIDVKKTCQASVPIQEAVEKNCSGQLDGFLIKSLLESKIQAHIVANKEAFAGKMDFLVDFADYLVRFKRHQALLVRVSCRFRAPLIRRMSAIRTHTPAIRAWVTVARDKVAKKLAVWKMVLDETKRAIGLRKRAHVIIRLYLRRFRMVRRVKSILASDSNCSICLENMADDGPLSVLSCGHIFHESCFADYKRTWNEPEEGYDCDVFGCALCRHPIQSADDVDTYNNNN